MNELVSIIVPVYKVEKYLPECMDSLINQSYKNLEIIVVDDESPDGSPAICDEYSIKDLRVKVFHVKNGGVSRARNLGVTKATGEWLMFLDSDDYLDLNAIQKMLECAHKYDSDIVSCAYYCTYVNKNILSGHNDGEYVEQSFNADSFIREMLVFPQKALSNYPTCLVPWGKIIKRELLTSQKISFPLDLHPHEDALFNVQLFMQARKQSYVHQPLLFYRQRDNASTKSKTKDNFSNNKKFCEYAFQIKDTKGNPIFSEEDYAVTCSKYFVYGMVNLWAFSENRHAIAKKQLEKYLSDDLYSTQLQRAQQSDLTKYEFSNRLRLSVDAARRNKIKTLLFYAKLSDIRAALKEKNPIIGNKIFQ